MADILDKRPMDDEMTIFKTEVEPYKLNACIDNILMRVDRLETKFADVQPVKHGRWLEHHAIWIDQSYIEGWFVQAKCSECERWAHVMNPYTKSIDYECCPRCGARMDGDIE